ncbi:MAG: sel1 repeat family protein, partial [Alphaproteobacteria bacterium]|nr:sel1 repeat family protein [Alphaproteobacteria bacterium]MBP9776336.1 sel1 repeat family protein [Alphaproteobacteria bacterium]
MRTATTDARQAPSSPVVLLPETLDSPIPSSSSTASSSSSLSVPSGEERVFEALKQTATNGDILAQIKLGRMYEEGRGVGGRSEANDVIAVGWYRQAAEKEDARAQNNLGWMYMEGRG